MIAKNFLVSAMAMFCMCGLVYADGEGIIASRGTVNTDQSIRSMADWYDMVQVNDISALGDTIVVGTTWPSYILKGFHNFRSDSTVTMRVRTERGSIVKITIPANGWSGKLPPILKVYGTSSDSTLFLFQKR